MLQAYSRPHFIEAAIWGAWTAYVAVGGRSLQGTTVMVFHAVRKRQQGIMIWEALHASHATSHSGSVVQRTLSV